MEFINLNELNEGVKLASFEDTAMFLNITYPELVEELLDAYCDASDCEIIHEIVDILNLPIKCVLEPSNKGAIIHGYINQAVKA